MTPARTAELEEEIVQRRRAGEYIPQVDSWFPRRQRERSGLSLSEVEERLSAKTRNDYSRYEQGSSMPSLEKLTELYQAVAPGKDIVIRDSAIA